ncbi:MAG: GTP-binding protein [Eubacteriales bacterium]|nr:GTP-binding protein [Eubacteriales bacterium]
MKQKSIPIALITGYLGAGKTTLLNHILNNQNGYRVAVIVNDIGTVNIDAELITQGGYVKEADNSLIPLTNGCICCTLKLDLVRQLAELARSGRVDYIMIEASGVCEPIPIAQTVTMMSMALKNKGLPPICHLDNVIVVADTLRLVHEFGCGEYFLDGTADEEDIESLLIQQLEFCNTVVMNKVEMVSVEEKNRVRAVIHALSPEAVILETSFGKAELSQLLEVKRFDYEKACMSAGWIEALDNPEEKEPETLEYGIDTFVYYRRKPLVREKFEKLLKTWPSGVIRTKGFLWLEKEPDQVYVFEQAGIQASMSEDGTWIASAPAEEQKQFLAKDPEIRKNWDTTYGDRMVKLVFIGRDMDKEKICRLLDSCLGK